MKYIIKNCENYDPFLQEPTCNKYPCDCQTKTDCLLKKIVEKCRETCRKRCTNDCLGTKKHCGYGQVLQLLDIEECE